MSIARRVVSAWLLGLLVLINGPVAAFAALSGPQDKCCCKGKNGMCCRLHSHAPGWYAAPECGPNCGTAIGSQASPTVAGYPASTCSDPRLPVQEIAVADRTNAVSSAVPTALRQRPPPVS